MNKTRLKRGEGPGGDTGQLREGGASKTAEIIDLLQRAQGATIDELMAATGWLPHTTRTALTDLRKRGYKIARSRLDGVTRYRIEGVDRALKRRPRRQRWGRLGNAS